jgi:hypothetical protein
MPGSRSLSFAEVIRDKGKAPTLEVGEISPLHGVGSSSGVQPSSQQAGGAGGGFMTDVARGPKNRGNHCM